MRSNLWMINGLASLIVVLVGLLLGSVDKGFGNLFTNQIALITFFLMWIIYNQLTSCNEDDD